MQQGNIIKLPRVSVLMATYNGIDYLEEQIMSILSQKGVIISLFISDDCSDDDTVGLLKRYKKKYDNIFIVSKNKKFGSAARNFLSLLNDHDATNFDYIALADQDDIWLDSKIYRSINCFNKLNSSGYSSNVTSWKEPNNLKNKIIFDQKQTKYDFMFQGPGPGCSFVLKSDSAQKLILFIRSLSQSEVDQIWFHDWLIYAFFRFNNHKWHIDNESHILYRQHDSNVLGANEGNKASLKRMKLIYTKEYRQQILFLSKVIGYERHLPIFKFNLFNFCFILSPFKTRRKPLHGLILFILSVFRAF